MGYKLSVKEDAKQHIINGFNWYEEKSSGLGSRFINEVEEILKYIQTYPHHYQIKFKNLREGVLKIFPYVVIYEILENDIVVYSVFPTRDNPNKKP